VGFVKRAVIEQEEMEASRISRNEVVEEELKARRIKGGQFQKEALAGERLDGTIQVETLKAIRCW
jgi:hypothetical protein